MARTMRWATVGSGTRNARAISSVVRPPSRRSVSATRASVERTGWQAVNIEAQQVVADVVVEGRVEVRRGRLLVRPASPAADLLVLALEQLVPAQEVDGPMLRGGHEPGARVVRDARLGPLLERGDEGVLGELLGQADVAHDPREAGDEPGRLDPPDRVDGAMGVGSRHGYRSHRHSTDRDKSTRRDYFFASDLRVAAGSSCSLQLGRELGAEVLRLEHRANLDLGLARASGWGSA